MAILEEAGLAVWDNKHAVQVHTAQCILHTAHCTLHTGWLSIRPASPPPGRPARPFLTAPSPASPQPPRPCARDVAPSRKPSLIGSWRNGNQRIRSRSSPPPGPQAGVFASDTVLIKKQEMLVLVELEGREELKGGEEENPLFMLLLVL